MGTRLLILIGFAGIALSGCASTDVATTGGTASLARPGSSTNITSPGGVKRAALKRTTRKRAMRGRQIAVPDEASDQAGPLAAALEKCTQRMDAVLKGGKDAATSAADKVRADLECRAVRKMVVR